MNPGLALVSLAVAAPVLSAQVSPAGSPVGARTAFALSVMERIAEERDASVAQGRRPRASRSLVGRLSLVGYRILFVHASAEDGRVALVPSQGFEVPLALDHVRWAVYAVPGGSSADHEHTLFLAADGPVLWSEATRYYAQDLPAPDAAFGRGCDGRWSSRQRGAGKGEDGDVWQTSSMLPRTACELTVVDADGAPFPGVEVCLTVAGSFVVGLPPGAAMPGRWPAGVVEADGGGKARLTGVPADGLVLRCSVGGTSLCVDETMIRCEGSSVRLTLPSTARDPQRLAANEAAAAATLRNISSAQSQCKASSVIDVDHDGVGEYGFFAELAGAVAVRSDEKGGVGETRIVPPVLSTAFSRVTRSLVRRSGYCFRIFLRDPGGNWVAEDADGEGGAGVAVVAEAAERTWCCFAWPERHTWTGTRAFFVDQNGEVLELANGKGEFSGAAAPKPWTTAEPPAGWVPASPRPAPR